MLRKLGRAIYRGIFWTCERGTWQYDIVVILILSFVFLTPRRWFMEQPASPFPADVVLLRAEQDVNVYRLDASILDRSSESAVTQSALGILSSAIGKPVAITRIEPFERDSEGRVLSYAVWIRE